ncbi:lipid IV(A) 3-deoxy-D-manno-octulosonic acid transferase [Spongiibacter sp. KMU-158]|uniref:3-deoxy-D-manno-octulosonic acid transferase n=1 Tax=Spongiibacter pelagi TaxID=2760804 RepID=A0A927GUX8_9GAMM|nr:lipid IV(A) 3-deoxy-D-manno-octulosonic acid transferase [Spongiibacter pelagi]MBD2857493.1 lipid IV(A) 3-deoxy-D-manno-octulosonic acid transferase [Spongiibacter pelagi]
MPRFIYSLLFYCLLPLVLLRLCYRAWRAPDYRRRILERFGFFKAPAQNGGLWVHAVSVGEVIAAAPIIEHFLAAQPELPVVVTTMTPTGSDRVVDRFGDRVFHVYAPYDLPDAVARFLFRVKPRVAVIMETEVWPNLVSQTASRGVPVILANARLSEKSARGYQRLSNLSRTVLNRFQYILVQAAADGERFKALGVAPEKVQVTGSVKFDVTIPNALLEQAEAAKSDFAGRPVWIAASTHAGEDEQLLAAHKSLLKTFPELLLILVPRHPERFNQVADLIEQQGLQCLRRSSAGPVAAHHQVLLGDTMGELLLMYGLADIAFVGGSLVPRGGHNCLEPAAWGLPVVVGESDFNFAEAASLLDQARARRVVNDASALVTTVTELLNSPEQRREMGEAAKAVLDENRGALRRQLDVIEAELKR